MAVFAEFVVTLFEFVDACEKRNASPTARAPPETVPRITALPRVL